MKILFVASDEIPHIGGKSTHILDLRDGLKENNVDSEIISLRNIGRHRKIMIKLMLSPIKILNTKIFSYYFRYISGRQISKEVYKYCKKNKVDCISVQDAAAAYFLKDIVKKLNIPVVMTMHTYFGLENSLDIEMTKYARIAYEKYLSNELMSLEIVNGIIAVDDRIKKHIQDTIKDRYDKKNNIKYIDSIKNFTNTDKYKICNEEDKIKIRESLNIEPHKFVISCARRLVEKNGVIELIKAMKLIEDKDILLLVGGDGPQKELIKSYISENKLQDRIILLGELEGYKIKELYKASDISVVPSITVNGLQEATSISAIEAMACGLPTIASNIGGLSQLIKNNHTGILVEEGNPKAIANAIIELKINKKYYNTIRINARESIKDNHSHIEAANKYLEKFNIAIE